MTCCIKEGGASADEYAWQVETTDGLVLTEEDKMPDDSVRARVRLMRLMLRGSSAVFKVAIAPGQRLIFFRRTRLIYAEGAGVIGQQTFFYLGFATRRWLLVRARKSVLCLSWAEDGGLVAEVLDKDGRRD